MSFLRFRGSRAGLFNDLPAEDPPEAGEVLPLRRSPPAVEPRVPPQISHEKTAPFHQSLRKDIAILPLGLLSDQGGNYAYGLSCRALDFHIDPA